MENDYERYRLIAELCTRNALKSQNSDEGKTRV